MSESDYYGTTRPRIKKETEESLGDMREKLEFMLENDENVDYIKEHYTGKQGKLSKAEIMDEAMEALKKRGLIDN